VLVRYVENRLNALPPKSLEPGQLYFSAQEPTKDSLNDNTDQDNVHCLKGTSNSSSESLSSLETLISRLKQGFLRRDEAHIDRIFQRFAVGGKISLHNLRPALKELHSNHAYQIQNKLQKLFDVHDLDNSGGLELGEFVRLLKVPSPVAQWATTLQLQDMLADCFDFPGDHDNQLLLLSQLTNENILMIAKAFEAGLCVLLTEQTEKLKAVLNAATMKEQALKTASEKFAASRYKCGDLKDFHAGLTARVGKLLIKECAL
jgi:Ca2+-binding EF-hand superfamily protein